MRFVAIHLNVLLFHLQRLTERNKCLQNHLMGMNRVATSVENRLPIASSSDESTVVEDTNAQSVSGPVKKRKIAKKPSEEKSA